MKIVGEYCNKRGQVVRVELVTGGEVDVVRVIGAEGSGLCFGAGGVVIESEVNDTFDVLLCQSARICLQARGLERVLFQRGCRDGVVRVWLDGRCVFAGFIEPRTYGRPFNAVWDDVEVNCIGGLAALQYRRYRDVGRMGVDYASIKRGAGVRSLRDIVVEILGGVVGEEVWHCYYDGSKALDEAVESGDRIFEQMGVSEALFLGDEEGDVLTEGEVLELILRYLDLHVMQYGVDFFVFSWEGVKRGREMVWCDLVGGGRRYTHRHVRGIGMESVADDGTQVEMGEVYNRLLLTCKVEEMDDVVENPLERDALGSPYSRGQKFLTEYIVNKGYGNWADELRNMVQGRDVLDGDCYRVDWYARIMEHPRWRFYEVGMQDSHELYWKDGLHQGAVLLQNYYRGAYLVRVGCVKRCDLVKDDAPMGRLQMEDYLVIGVGGEGPYESGEMLPSGETLREGYPVAVYESGSVGMLSPVDGGVRNYMVISGKIRLNPWVQESASYERIRYDKTSGHVDYDRVGRKGGMRFYTRQWWDALSPESVPVCDVGNVDGFLPPNDQDVEAFEYRYNMNGGVVDDLSKVGVLWCMLRVGDKCLVEKPKGVDLGTGVVGTGRGVVDDYVWMPYKERGACVDDEEYYGQAFTIGINPKIGDSIVGREFDIQNNITYEMNLDVEGMAIPIGRDDRVVGKVHFEILGVVPWVWNGRLSQKKWGYDSVLDDEWWLMGSVRHVTLKDLEIRMYSDNGGDDPVEEERDIVYRSDTDEAYTNVKDDIEFRLCSALSVEECRALGVRNGVHLSTPVRLRREGGAGGSVWEVMEAPVQVIYDRVQGVWAKAEQLYVDAYYREYHVPRVVMEQALVDGGDGWEDLFFDLYVHPAVDGYLYVQGMGRDLMEGTVHLTLKEGVERVEDMVETDE